MKAKEITVSIRYVKNLGNYQSFTAEAGITAEVEPGENPEDVFAKSWTMAKEQVKGQLLSLKNNNQEVM